MAKKPPIQAMEHVQKFLTELEAYCAGRHISASTFCNRVIGNTYTGQAMLRSAQKIETTISIPRGAMALAPVIAPANPDEPLGPAEITLTLTVSTSANRLKKPVRQVLKSGQVVSGMKRNKEYNAWRRVAMQEILAQRPALAVKTLGPGWYNLSLRLAMQDPAGIDNREKSVADVLVAMGVTPDDRWMHSKDTQRSKEVPLGKCVVTVSQVFGAEKI